MKTKLNRVRSNKDKEIFGNKYAVSNIFGKKSAMVQLVEEEEIAVSNNKRKLKLQQRYENYEELLVTNKAVREDERK